MPGLLTAERRTAREHLLEHVAVPHLRLDDVDPGVPHRRAEAEVRHHGADDGRTREPPLLLQRDRARGEHLVPVDDPTLRVGEERSIRVAVVRDAGVGARRSDHAGHDLRVERPAPCVDVRAVRLVEDRVHLGPETPEHLGRERRGRPVRAVDDDLHAVESRLGGGHHVVEVVTDAVRHRHHLADPTILGRGSGGDLGLDLGLDLVGELEAERAEELDAVVLGRVVRGADHDAGTHLEIGRQERDGRRRLHPGEDHVGTRRPDPIGERPLQRLPRGSGVAPDHERRKVMLVPPEHDDRRTSQREREVVGQVAPVHAAHAVGSEELPHRRAKATRRSRGGGVGRPATGSAGGATLTA